MLARAVNADRELVARQALGCLASLVAHEIEVPLGPDEPLLMMPMLREALREAVQIAEWNNFEFCQRIRTKQAKLWRHEPDLDCVVMRICAP